jgi:hypothetical protein
MSLSRKTNNAEVEILNLIAKKLLSGMILSHWHRWSKTIRKRMSNFSQPRFWDAESRMKVLVVALPLVTLMLLFTGIWEIWSYTSDDPEILGRYSRQYFYPALAYHVFAFVWASLSVVFYGQVLKEGIGSILRVLRKYFASHFLNWIALVILWGLWLLSWLIFPTKVTTIQMIATFMALASISVLIVLVDWKDNRLPKILSSLSLGWLRDRDYSFNRKLPRFLYFLPVVIFSFSILSTWIVGMRGGFFGSGNLGTALTLFLLVILPGWLVCLAFKWEQDVALPGRMALWFALGAGLLMSIASLGRLFQVHVRYSVFVIAMIESVLFFLVFNQQRKSFIKSELISVSFRIRKSTALLLLIALVGTVWILYVADQLAMFRYAPTRDTWNYSKNVLWFLQHPADPLVPRRILGMLNPRMFTNGWLFMMSVIAWAQPIDPARLISVNTPMILTIVGLAAVFYLAYIVAKKNWRGALLSVIFTQAVLSLGLSLSRVERLTHRGVPEVFLMRIADDKIAAFFLLLPIALGLSYRVLSEKHTGSIIPLGLTLIGLTWTHPMGIAGYGICMAGFGLFQIFVSARSVHYRMWVIIGMISVPLAALSIIMDSGLLLSPSVKETITSESRYAGISLTETIEGVHLGDFLIVDRPADPKGVDNSLNPIYLEMWYTPLLKHGIVVALVLVVFSWRRKSTHFVSGITLLTVFLLYMPEVDVFFAKIISRSFSWRFLFQIPLGLIFTMGLISFEEIFNKISFRWFHVKLFPTLIPLVTLICMFFVIQDAYLHLEDRRAVYLRDKPSSDAWDVIEQLGELGDGDTLVMAPRHLNPLIMGFGKGHVFYVKGPDLNKAGIEWLNRFFDGSNQLMTIQDQAYFYLLINAFKFELLIMPRAHVLNESVFMPSENFQLVGENSSYLIFQIDQPLCWPLGNMECNKLSKIKSSWGDIPFTIYLPVMTMDN